MPLEPEEFPEEVQVAFFIYAFLSDKIEGMSGTYMGKDFLEVDLYLNLHGIKDRKETVFWLKVIDNVNVSIHRERQDRERKSEERRSSSSGDGKKYVHNVKG